jgi:hypothetical protein
MLKISTIGVITTMLFATNMYAQESMRWNLQFVSGYNRILIPMERNTVQNALVMRYAVNRQSSIALQVGHNYSIENNLHDLRLGIRLQFELLRW